jgi:oxalate---CoA ligase
VLLAHPAVAQAVTFAVPHTTLGEDVAAAVVLREGASVAEHELRDFVRWQVADYKVPQQILVVDRIPVGPSGKLQRIGLAATLAERLQPDFVAPRDDLEAQLAAVWAEVLKLERVSVTANFFSLGGDSLKAMLVASKAAPTGVTPDIVFQQPTIAEIAAEHRRRRADEARPA